MNILVLVFKLSNQQLEFPIMSFIPLRRKLSLPPFVTTGDGGFVRVRVKATLNPTPSVTHAEGLTELFFSFCNRRRRLRGVQGPALPGGG